MSSSPLLGDSATSARLGSRCGVAPADVGLWVLLRDTERLPVGAGNDESPKASTPQCYINALPVNAIATSHPA